MRRSTCLSALLLLWHMGTLRADTRVSVVFRNGRVSVKAFDATPQDIINEWSRQGGTRIVNARAIPGRPETLELVDVLERRALDVVLRNAAGYVAAPRTGALDGLSEYDRILILASPGAPLAPPAGADQSRSGAATTDRAAATAAPPRSTEVVDVDEGQAGLPAALADVLRLNPPDPVQPHDRDAK